MQSAVMGAGVMPPWPTAGNSSYDSASRRRIQLTCEACLARKTKCEVEGTNTACTQCIRRNKPCKFPSRKEKRENLKRNHYVKSLEERLEKMETLLKAAGLVNEDTIVHDNSDDENDHLNDSGDDDDNDNEYHSSFAGSSRQHSRERKLHAARDSDSASVGRDQIITVDTTSTSHRKPLPEDSYSTKPSERGRSEHDSNTMHQPPVFRWDSREDSRYYGRSSFLSILSRDGIEWIKNKTGEVKFLNLLFSDTNRDTPWDYWRPDVFHDLFSSKVFKALPPRAEVFSLLRQYFRTVNRLFPIYHEETFMRLVEWQYTQQTCDDAARWASINIILSLAYEYRFSNSQKSERDRERAWLYFKNAMSVFPELALRRTDMLSVQALLGMAIFLRGNSGTQSALPLITAAIRTCHRMGMHRNIPRPHLSPVEQEQRKRVFWIAYFMDQSVCIRSGNAPTQQPDDFDIGLPAKGAEDEFIMAKDSSFFYQLCHMATVKSRIYSRLYATTALKNKSPLEVLEIVRELHQDLEDWKNESAFTQLKRRDSGDDFLVGFATAGLRCLYYNSLIMIHRLPQIMHYAYLHRLASGSHMHYDYKKIMQESSASGAICVQAARDTLKLVNNLPWGDIAWIWSLLYYVFFAVMTIFVSILRDSQNPKAKEDLQSLNMAATFFATLLPGDESCNYARFMTRMCANFERVARTVLERDQKAAKPGDKASQPQISITAATAAKGGVASTTEERDQHEAAMSAASNGVNIPHLEGLPRINSSGYVVPDSLSDIDDSFPDSNNPTHASSSLHPDTNISHPTHRIPTNGTGLPQPGQHQHLNPHNNHTTPNDPYSIENMFPISVTESFSQPELWQIPLTADWEFGGQFLGGLFGQNMFAPDPSTMPASNTTPATTASMPPTSMDMGYGFMNQGEEQGHPQQQQQQHPLWPPGGSFMNPYY